MSDYMFSIRKMWLIYLIQKLLFYIRHSNSSPLLMLFVFWTDTAYPNPENNIGCQ